MAKLDVFDFPIVNPDDDLFNMANYAESLAKFIEIIKPPFTIGVYGEWGDGKTSFVRLLQHYLQSYIAPDNIKFIYFSAWQHTTSDSLWRALIIKIAKELYDIPEIETPILSPVPAQTSKNGIWDFLKVFLTNDAFTLQKEVLPPDPLAEYKDIMSRLDKSGYGSISKSKEQQVSVNQDVALLSVVNATISALGTISPLIAGLRSLMGIEPKVNLSELLHTEKNVATRDIIESIQEFKQIFREIFEDKAKDKKVFVFVDDLDRCLPDVALDILEAIKMFLDEIGCFFIVAADENLIGQGLKLRYQELIKSTDDTYVQTFFTQKGQEYFEKIIQFAVRVPPRTLQQAHTFISAQFPMWTPATDIIQTTVGNNPRRLKQYCNLLTYKHMVSQIQKENRLDESNQQTAMEQTKKQFLNKIITLYSWSEHCFEIMCNLTSQPEEFAQMMLKIETLVEASQEDIVLPQAKDELNDEHQYHLYEAAIKSSPLFNLIKSSPRFSEMPLEDITTFTQFADIHSYTKGTTTLSTKDAVFMNILSAVETQGVLTIKRLLIENLTKLIYFDKEYKDIFVKILELYQTKGWMPQLIAIESELDPASIMHEYRAKELSETAKELLDMLGQKNGQNASNECQLFLDRPRFSAILKEEVQLYCEIQESIIKPEALDVEDTNHARLLIEAYRTIANEKLNSYKPEKLKPIISSLDIRYEAAQYFLELRKFAKVDALSYKWSELAFQFMINAPAPLNLLEAWIMDTKELAEPLPPNLSKYLDNDQFVRFLRLRPLFRDIYNYEVKGYFAASNAVAKSEPIQPIISDVNIVSGDKFQYKSSAAFENKSEYKDFYIKIKPHLEQFEVTLESGSDNFTEHAVEIPFQEFEKFKSVSPASFSMRDAELEFQDQAELLKEQGTLLYNTIFASDSLKSFFVSALKEEVKRRIVIEFDNQLLSKLPWESLYIPELEIFPALYTRFSIVRNFPNPSPINRRTLTPPLRILVVTANPKDLSPLALEDEILTMEKTLVDAIRNGQAKLEIIRHATIDAIQQNLRRFQPHLFHFAGHAVVSQESQGGLLILENSDGSMRKLEASLLKSLLVDSNISLAVLNGCDTGTNNSVNAVTSLAGELVKGGITAAIATTEALLDSAALMFSREFYRAFVDGYTLEESITEARKAICMERLNWASYTLFSGTTNLDLFKLTLSRTSKDN